MQTSAVLFDAIAVKRINWARHVEDVIESAWLWGIFAIFCEALEISTVGIGKKHLVVLWVLQLRATIAIKQKVLQLLLEAEHFILWFRIGWQWRNNETWIKFDEHIPKPLKVLRFPLDFPTDANWAILVPGYGLDSKEKIGIFNDFIEKVAWLILEFFDTSSAIWYFVMVI